MDYHSDRFEDASLMVFKQEKLIALLPANKKGNDLISHQGLTYGGLMLQQKTSFKEAYGAFKAILDFCKSQQVNMLVLKVLPKIYNVYPSDELDYFLFLAKAKLIRRDISSAIDYSNPLRIKANRMEGVKKAHKRNLRIQEVDVFNEFWDSILIPNLRQKHQTNPVHTLEEIELLKSKFPKQIRQFNVYKDAVIVAGATIFETKQVAHVQYISANEDKQQLGSLDYLFAHLINDVFNHKAYFNFGISNENQGLKVNEGLLFWKEGFGARTVVHDFYEISINHCEMPNTIFV